MLLAPLMLQSALLAGGLTQSIPPADSVDISTRMTTGTGLSVAGAGGTSLTARSPGFLTAEIGMRPSTLSGLELTGGFTMEVEGRTSLGLLARARAHIPSRRRISGYAIGGVPLFVHPFSLLGAQVGLGTQLEVHRHVSLVAEGTATAFFAGSDLMKGSVLGKFDLGLGLEIRF